MSENIKIGVSANVDLGGLDSALANAAKSADALSKSMSGGALSLDTVEFEQQINKSTALLKVLYEKIQEKKQLGISTETADAQLKEFTQRKSDATKVLLGSQPSNGGQTPTQRAEQVNRKEIEETTRVLQRYNREATSRDGAEVVRRTKYSQNAHAQYHQGSFAGLDSDTSPGAIAERNRIMRNAGLSPGKAGAGPGGKPASSQFSGRMAGAAIGMAGGMIGGGAGGDGMATAGSALGGMIGSAFGPVGSMIGGALGGMAGGLVGGGMGDAKEEAIGITDLRSSLGATSVQFDALRESARAAASGMGMTSLESTRLAKQFAHTAGTQSKDARSLASEVRMASGLSRSLGIDPSLGVSAMSTLRNTHATTDEASSRRMAMTIAEAISKGGMSSKGDEVLSAIASFAQANARSSLQAPNVTGYSDYMSRMVGMKTPGLDVQGTASLLGKADAGIRSHGDLASEVFKLGSFTKAFGNEFTAPDMDLYTAQGAFGTSRSVAQDILDDPTADDARKKSARDVLKSGNADRPIQDLMMDNLGTVAPRGSAMYEQSGAHLFGMEHNEFRKFNQAYYSPDGGSDGMKSQLDAMGVNTAKLDPKKFMHMGALLGSNKSELNSEGERLISGTGYDKQLNDEQKKNLRKVMSIGNEGDLKKEIIKLQEGRELTDIGTDTRNKVADVNQSVINLSASLLPAVDKVRDAVLIMGSSSPEKLAAAQKKWALDSKEQEIRNSANEDVKRIQKDHDAGKISESDRMKQTAGVLLEADKKVAAMSKQYDVDHATKQDATAVEGGSVNKPSGRIYEMFDALNRGDFKEAARLKAGRKSEGQALSRPSLSGAMGVKLSEDEEAQLHAVSGDDHKKEKFLRTLLQIENRGKGKVDNFAVSPVGAKGAFQFMPKTADGYMGRAGMSGYNLNNFADSSKLAGAYYDDLNSRYKGDEAKMLADYNGGPSKAVRAGNTGNKENDDYVQIGTRLLNDSDSGRVPDQAKPKSQDSAQAASGDHTVTVIVKSAENKFAPEKVKVNIAARSRGAGATAGIPA